MRPRRTQAGKKMENKKEKRKVGEKKEKKIYISFKKNEKYREE